MTRRAHSVVWQDATFGADHADPERAADALTRALEGLPFSSDPDLVPLRPMVMRREALDELGSAARELVSLVERVCRRLTEDPWELARLSGMRPDQVPFIGAGGVEDEWSFAACNVRPDAYIVDGTPMFLECNFGAANSGPITSHMLRKTYHSLYGISPRPLRGEAEGAFEARADFYRRICEKRGVPLRVAILGTMREEDIDDPRYFGVEAEYLESVGIESSFVEPEELADDPRRWSVVQKHFLPEEWIRLGIPLEGISKAHRESAFMVSDSGLSLSSKRVFAWLGSGQVPLSQSEREFVRRHVPWTREVVAGPVDFEGREHGIEELALRSREKFVLKPVNACGGEGVVVGRATTDERWKAALTAALGSRNHVLQEYIEPDAGRMEFWDRASGRVRDLEVDYVLGPYIVDGVSAGCTVRHVQKGRNGVVNHARGAALNIVLPADPAES